MFDRVDRTLRCPAVAGSGETAVIVADGRTGGPGSTGAPRVPRVGVPVRVA
ncbi:MAG: hypothetical protein FWJ70_04160 [Micromonosporaceae bacterium]